MMKKAIKFGIPVLASALPETQAEEMYERLIPFFNAVRP